MPSHWLVATVVAVATVGAFTVYVGAETGNAPFTSTSSNAGPSGTGAGPGSGGTTIQFGPAGGSSSTPTTAPNSPASSVAGGTGRSASSVATLKAIARNPGTGQPQPAPDAQVSPTTTSVNTPQVDAAGAGATTSADFVSVQGTQLMLGGQPYRFVGVDAYEIGTEWGVNTGCGGEETTAQLDQLFGSLPANSLVRFWAFQGDIGTDKATGQLNWGPLDRVFAAAAAYHQRLIVVLGDQAGTCDGGTWQDPAWYSGGYNDIYNSASDSDGQGLTPLPYSTYVADVVGRYAGSPALGMWEPMSEAEASTCPAQYEPGNCSGHQTCPDETAAAHALRSFFDAIGGEIHGLDPNHLVESGLLGGGQCGTAGADYQYVSDSPGIDVLSYHDYYGSSPMGGDQWNGIAVRIAQAKALDKPIIAGEVGIEAGSGGGCTSASERVTDIQAKMAAQFSSGISGMLVWDWTTAPSSPCTYDTYPGDPLMTLIGEGPP